MMPNLFFHLLVNTNLSTVYANRFGLGVVGLGAAGIETTTSD